MTTNKKNTPELKALESAGQSAARDADDAEGVSRVMAHEMANLLDGSLRNLSLALGSLNGGGEDNTIAGEEPVGAVVRQLETASVGMTQMVRLLRGWMRESGKGMGALSELMGEASTVGEAVGYAVSMARPLAAERGVEIGYAVSSEAEGVLAGPVYQVLANALGNAIEAVGTVRASGGFVRVSVEVDGTTWDEAEIVLTVSDNGPGMLAEIPRDDYGFFARGVTTKAQGHGLGLWICRQMIEELGGVMRLEDGARGGTTLIGRWGIGALGIDPPVKKSVFETAEER